MQVIRAEHLGMCFGVRDAIALAFGRAEAAPLTVLGDLVHNTVVLEALVRVGIAIAHDPAQVETETVMVTAHGASERALADTRARGLEIVEATCPLVQVAHRAVRTLVHDGITRDHRRSGPMSKCAVSPETSTTSTSCWTTSDVLALARASAAGHRGSDHPADQPGAMPGRLIRPAILTPTSDSSIPFAVPPRSVKAPP